MQPRRPQPLCERGLVLANRFSLATQTCCSTVCRFKALPIHALTRALAHTLTRKQSKTINSAQRKHTNQSGHHFSSCSLGELELATSGVQGAGAAGTRSHFAPPGSPPGPDAWVNTCVQIQKQRRESRRGREREGVLQETHSEGVREKEQPLAKEGVRERGRGKRA